MTEHEDKRAGLMAQALKAASKRLLVEAAVESADSTLVVVGIDRTSEQPMVMRLLVSDARTGDSAAKRFVRAGQMVSLIDSPYVAAIREVGTLEPDGPPYWLAEQAAGTSIRELLSLGRPVPVPTAIEYAVEACRALRAAHACQLVHGRLRPSKLFRIPHADPVRIKVIDIGLAAATAPISGRGSSRSPSTDGGGPEYRSPELAAGSRRFEVASDIWGLGVTVYEMVTGRHPFPASGTRAEFARSVAEGPPSLQSAGIEAPARLEELLREMLRKDASQRPSSAAFVEQRLLELAKELGSKPAEPPSTGRRRTPVRADAGEDAGAAMRETDASPGSSDQEPSPGRPTDSETPEPPVPRSTAGPPRFLGPAMGNRGVRVGSYSLSGGSLPQEEVLARRASRGPRRSESRAKRPSQRPRAIGADGAAARPERSVVKPRARRADAPGPAVPRAQALVKTDPATPRAIGERKEDELYERRRGTPDAAERAGDAVSADASVGANAPTEANAVPSQPVPVFDLDIDIQRGAPSRPAGAAGPTAGTTGEEDSPTDAPIPEDAPAAADAEGARPRLRTAPGSWTLDFSSGPGSWELDRTPSMPPAQAIRSDLPAALVRADAAGSEGASQDEDAPMVSWEEAVEEQLGAFHVERVAQLGTHVERLEAMAEAGPLRGALVWIERGVLGEELDGDHCQRLAQRVAAAKHPHLLGVHEVEREAEGAFVVFEHVDGADLRAIAHACASRSQPMPPEVVAYVGRRVAAALDAYHRTADGSAQPVARAHGDVRPSNVLVSATGEVKLGLPRVVADPRRAAGGKLDYLSPEELRGRSEDGSSDLFALGVMLGELLVGEPLFPGSGLDALVAVANAEAVALRRRSRELPAPLLAVCERLLAREPIDRFESAMAVADALEPLECDGTRCAQSLAGLVAIAAKRPERITATATDHGPERTARSTLADQMAAARQIRTDSSAPLLRVRRAHSGLIGQLPYCGVLEAVSTGNLGPDDEVTWEGTGFKPLRDVPCFAERLMLSAPALGGNLTERRAADHLYHSREVSMLEVLAQMRLCRANALVLVEDLSSESNRRTEIYLHEGQVSGVRSSDPSELFGEWLAARGTLERARLSDACRVLPAFDGKIGNALIGLGLAEGLDLIGLVRQQMCARISRTFGWLESRARVYLAKEPPVTPFALRLDLTEAMMIGVLVAADGEPAGMLPGMLAQIEPGARAPATEGRELRELPAALSAIASILGSRPVVAQAIRALESRAAVTTQEATAALVVAQALRWITVRAPGS